MSANREERIFGQRGSASLRDTVTPQFAALVAAIVDKLRVVAIGDGVFVDGKRRDLNDVSPALDIEEPPGSRVDGTELVPSADVDDGLLAGIFSLITDRECVVLVPSPFSLVMMSPSAVGEIMKTMSQTKVLVKVNPEGKYVVDVDQSRVDIQKCAPNARVALKNDSYELHKILPTKVDPLVSLMKVEKVPDSTYDVVGGLEKQIREIKEVIELPVKHPELFETLGVAQPKGVLLYGPPGTGKTLLARAVSHHTDCTFIRVSGAELVQKYIGEGSRMVRELFVMAREAAPSIVFMDEIDSIGSSRTEGRRVGRRRF